MTDASLTGQHRSLTPPRFSELRRRAIAWGERVPSGPVRFLLAGGFASAINWLARFPLSAVLPFWLAVAIAYAVGMAFGFEVYRRWVFPGSTLKIHTQAMRFIAVNLVGMITVIGSAAALAPLLCLAVLSPAGAEGVAHGIAIVAGAAVNYLGHRAVTFARGCRRPQDD